MYFFEDTCIPSNDSEIEYCENKLEFDILNHKASFAVSIYEQQMYLEDGASDDGVFEKMKKAILAILDKVDSLIRGFFDSFKIFSDNRLTADKYMNSETAEVRLDADLFEMEKRVDKAYLEARPVIKKISTATGAELEKVAKKCDDITDFVNNNGSKIVDTGVNVVSTVAVDKLVNKCASQMDDVKQWKKLTEESVARMDAKKDKDAVPRAKATKSAARMISSIANAYTNIGNRAVRSLNKQNKKSKKGQK